MTHLLAILFLIEKKNNIERQFCENVMCATDQLPSLTSYRAIDSPMIDELPIRRGEDKAIWETSTDLLAVAISRDVFAI